jgi:hypothetical protein
MAAMDRSIPFGVPTNGSVRTVKSCGPDTPTLVSRTMRQGALSRYGGQKARCTEESTYKP